MLLKRFHRLFGHNESVVDHANWMTDRKQIIHILHRLQQDRCLMEARIGEHPDLFSTAIIGVNPKTDIMALDEIVPPEGNELFQTHKAMHLSGRSDGVEVEFDLNFIKVCEQGGIAYYQVGIPKAAIYIQRRGIHRVPLNGAPPFRGQFGQEGQRIFSGYAADLSQYGIGLVLKKLETLYRGDELSNCTVNLPGYPHFYFRLEIRFAQQIPHRRTTRIGGRFLDLSNKDRNRLAKFILQLERNHAPLEVR